MPDSLTRVSSKALTFLHSQLEKLGKCYFPDDQAPAFFAGYQLDDSQTIDYALTLTRAHGLGLFEASSHELALRISKLLGQIRGEDVLTFYSYRTSECLQHWGQISENELLAHFDSKQRDEILLAIDSTSVQSEILDGRYPNNYSAVLLRCELARKALGVDVDDTLIQTCIPHINTRMSASTHGFLDDLKNAQGRFDIYSFDTILFCEPFHAQLNQASLGQVLRSHNQLFEHLINESGACITWGRSTGILSLMMTLEWASFALRNGLCSSAERNLKIIEHTLLKLESWFKNGLATAHRDRSPYNYRGTHRYLQITADSLLKLSYVCENLQVHSEKIQLTKSAPSPELFPDDDAFIEFNDANAGVWCYRKGAIWFQLPVVFGQGFSAADYAAFPSSPGLFEAAVNTDFVNGLPRIVIDGTAYAPIGLPANIEKTPDCLKLTWSTLHHLENKRDTVEGAVNVHYKSTGSSLEFEVEVQLPTTAETIHWQLPKTKHRLLTESTSKPSATYRCAPVKGIKEWRSFWGELQQVHQWEIRNTSHVSYSLKISPELRVVVQLGQHDYNRSLYDPLLGMGVKQSDAIWGDRPETLSAETLVTQSAIVHIGWPEHILNRKYLGPDESDPAILQFLHDIREAPVKVVWTMHNRHPHHGSDDKNAWRLYQAAAQAADLVIHHSEWGKQQVIDTLPYKTNATHIVLPHGHYEELLDVGCEREKLEADYKLPSCRIRFGLLGLPNPHKQIPMVLSAFKKSGRDDIQLITDAITDDELFPNDPRIIQLPKERFMPREEVARRIALCDCLVSAHRPEKYLTSGIIADVAGAGIPLLGTKWEFYDEMLGPEGYFAHQNTEQSLTEWFDSLDEPKIKQGRQAATAARKRLDWQAISKTFQQTLMTLLD